MTAARSSAPVSVGHASASGGTGHASVGQLAERVREVLDRYVNHERSASFHVDLAELERRAAQAEEAFARPRSSRSVFWPGGWTDRRGRAVSAWVAIAAFLLGVGLGAYVERFRWLAWARREHPEEVDTSWL